MIASELLKLVRAHRGKLLAPIHGPNDVVHTAIEKKDFMETLAGMGNYECGLTMIELDNGMKCINSDDDVR